MRDVVDLNCDMGEGFGPWDLIDAPNDALMEVISSANVATGFHAGDPNTMNSVVALARDHGVGLGAHPAYRDLQGFGRRFIDMGTEELVNDILYQVGALREFGRRHGVALQHVKPHGALYMEVARNEELSVRLVEGLRQVGEPILFCMGVSKTYEIARQQGLPVVREFYSDRDYDDTGAIVFKRTVARPDPEAIARKCLRACKEGVVETESGKEVEVAFESICFHSDTPGSVEIGAAIRKILTDNGISVAQAATVLERLG